MSSGIFDNLVDNEISGVYRALVVNDKDPKHRGRIQIRIPALHGIPGDLSYVPDIELPWAVPATMAGVGVNSGQLIIPRPGMSVFVTYEANNIKDPIYLGTIPLLKNAYPIGSKPKGSDATFDGLYDSNNNVVKDILFRSETGKTIYVDRLTGDIHADIEGGGGSAIEIVDLTTLPPEA